ncbi:hypothetical protein SAMN05216410_1160 [Sanguibacter gelidistatuariae]|uniref:Uncharacterized protein n=1 Tax=Sanguibacter gelidistatuariae TaxID=1814289 RepID=A0A1G6HRE0_9MICO|nr:hypothetical protein [Sanguibacter gelidistatuariae]SDB96066.1 hypothetical protein SAMN05216410_1160 [Sanguibacter gelidistatuariae]
MQSSNHKTARVVSGVCLDGKPLLLVEDTWSADSEESPLESYRTWVADSGAEIRTRTSPVSSDSALSLGQRVADALSGTIMERLVMGGASREATVEAIRWVNAAQVRDEAACLTIDGEPRRGLSISVDGTGARGAIAGETLVLMISQAQLASLTLGPFEQRSTLGSETGK